nr:SAM-dependent methyltransferase [Vulcanococcus limneticus]
MEGFSHLFLLYLFDRAGSVKLVRRPFLDDRPHGIFASRHPCRPNGIGLSVVRLLERQGRNLIIEGVDVLDGTPLLDIKPYIPRFDFIPVASEGWFSGRPLRTKPAGLE